MGTKIVKVKTFADSLDSLKRMLDGRKVSLDVSHIVIVPDRYTLETEKRLFEGNSGAFDIDVTTVRRLAAKPAGGNGKARPVTRQGAIAKIAEIISASEAEFVSFRNAARKKGFAKTVYETIIQLKSCGIMPEDIKGGQSAALRKMSDIKYIYGKYEDFLRGSELTDAAGVLTGLRNSLERNPQKDTYYYMHGFYSMTAQVYGITAALAASGARLTVFVPAGQNGAVYNVAHEENLIKAFSGLNYTVEEGYCAQSRFLPLLDTVYTAAPASFDFGGAVRVFEAEDIVGELLYIARDIADKAASGTMRYKDAAIILNQPVYDIIKRVMGSFDVPVYVDRKQNLLQYPISQMLLTAVSAVRQRHRRREMIRLAKNPFMRIPKDDVQCFENFCIEYAVDYAGFSADFTGYGHKDAYLAGRAENVRKKLSALLAGLSGALAAAKTASDFEAALMNLLVGLDAPRTLSEMEEYDEYAGQIFERLKEVLAQLSDVLEGITLEDYCSALENALSGTEISVIPQRSDAVEIGDAASFVAKRAKVLYIAGLNDGLLPAQKSDAGLLSDRDITELRESGGLDIAPKVKAVNIEARNMLVYAATAAENLVLTYSLSDLAGEVLKPSVFLWQITSRCKDYEAEYQETLDRAAFDDSLMYGSEEESEEFMSALLKYAGNERGAKHYLLTAVRRYYEGRIAGLPRFARMLAARYLSGETRYLYTGGAAERLEEGYGMSGGKMRVTQLERYFACPYAHFLEYGLRAKPRPEGGIILSDIGNFLHSVMEKYTVGKHYLKPEPDDSIADELFYEVLKQYPGWDTEGNKARLDMLLKETRAALKDLKTELTETDFEVMACEMAFGAEDDPYRLQAGGEGIVLTGRIDRVDSFGELVRVVDYKTGNNVKSEASALYSGKSIQPYIYLEILKKRGFIPAGAFYHKINMDKAGGEPLLEGNYAYNRQVVDAMDRTAAGGKGVILGAKYTKQGELHKNDKRIKTLAEMSALTDYSARLAAKAAEEIMSGYIAASPLGGSCSYCLGKDFCAFDRSRGGQERSTPSVAFTDITAICGEVRQDEVE